MEREIRSAPFELRAASEDGGEFVEGYAIVFDSWSEKLGGDPGFRERVERGAVMFEADVRALVDHDSGKILASQSSGTLTFSIDEKGVYMRAKIPDVTYGRDVKELIRAKLMNRQSFSFRVRNGATRGDHWEQRDGQIWRSLRSIEVSEFSIVGNPAYRQTSAEMRSADAAVADYLKQACEIPLDLAEKRLLLMRSQLQ